MSLRSLASHHHPVVSAALAAAYSNHDVAATIGAVAPTHYIAVPTQREQQETLFQENSSGEQEKLFCCEYNTDEQEMITKTQFPSLFYPQLYYIVTSPLWISIANMKGVAQR